VLEDFTVTTFAERVGETFRVGDGAEAVEMELLEANEAPGRSEAVRVPFSIVFRGPVEPVLPQRTYRFEHDALGVFELFIVPIGPDESGMQYEAVFG
jgi:hypothetical protein